MVLGQESYKMLMTLDEGVLKKLNNPIVNQYLKVLKPIFYDQSLKMIEKTLQFMTYP